LEVEGKGAVADLGAVMAAVEVAAAAVEAAAVAVVANNPARPAGTLPRAWRKRPAALSFH